MKLIRATQAHSLDERHRDVLRKRLRQGEIHRVYRGAYVDTEGAARGSISAEEMFAACTAAVVGASQTAVACGLSAAVLHGLPVLHHRLRGPVTVNRLGPSRPVEGVRFMRAKLSDSDITEMYGLRVTTLERTIQDLASLVDAHELLAAADAALRLGANFDALDEPLHHRTVLRWVQAHANDRSDSFAESWSRYLMIEHGIEFELQQATILDERGQFLGRTDFASPLGLIGEFDGRIKYDGLLAPGENAADAVMAEKQREARLRECGWEMVRWGWTDLQNPQRFIRMLARGYERARALPAPRGEIILEPLRPPKRPDWSFLER